MAQTADEPIILSEWVLLREVRDLVARYGMLENAAAEELVLGYIREHPLIHWRWRESPGEHRTIDPRCWGVFSRYVCIPVDWDNSRVSYILLPPDSPYGLEAVIRETLGDLSAESDRFQILLVRLHRDYVLDMLRSFGFLLAEDESSSGEAKSEPLAAAPAVKSESKESASPAKGASAKEWITWDDQSLSKRRRKESKRARAERLSKVSGLKRKTFQNLLE